MNTIDECKGLMNRLIDLECSVSLQAGGGMDRGTFETEFLAAGLYVAGADNNISTIEVDLLNYLFDKDIDPQEMGPLINTLRQSFDSLIMELKMPGWVLCKGVDELQGTHAATDLYINTMEFVMTLFGAVDGNLDANEEKFIQDYLNRMRRDR